MYSVVGCTDCGAFWVVEGRPDTTACPRCDRRHQFDRLEQFVETADRDAAREARAALLAERSGETEAFEAVDAYADLEDAVESSGVDDETYLAASGVDPDAVAAAGERAAEGRGGGGSTDRVTVVREAVAALDDPDAEAVVDRAASRGVDPERAREVLARLRRSGDVVERNGTLRLV
ncbi:MAG: DUF5817 domain-containing protein [Halobacteriaceae archaeon]